MKSLIDSIRLCLLAITLGILVTLGYQRFAGVSLVVALIPGAILTFVLVGDTVRAARRKAEDAEPYAGPPSVLAIVARFSWAPRSSSELSGLAR